MASAPRLSVIDRYLTLWIFLAMMIGIGIGYFIPTATGIITGLSVGTTSIPIAIGLILMMYPPLAKVRYEELGAVLREKKIFGLAMVLNWVIAPFVMFALAVIFLRDQPDFMYGLILVGIAPCIAMVLVWNELAGGHCEYCAAIVGINSVFQVLLPSMLVLHHLPPVGLGIAGGAAVPVTIGEIAVTVFIFLGSFLAGLTTRRS
jgi:ACR3 family arsenite transporter